MRSSTDPTFGNLAELRSKMVKWAKAHTRGGSDAEDLVQAALLKMLSNRHRAPVVLAEVEPWARVVLLNTFRNEIKRHRQFVPIDDIQLAAPDNPETAVYCRQVCRLALGLDAGMLLAEPLSPEGATQRTRRRRARRILSEAVAA